jgi:hypothetical protein
MFNESDRGGAFQFGAMALRAFLRANGLHFMLRGHQCADGVESLPNMGVATVFSSSMYDPGGSNRCGVVAVGSDGTMTPIIFENGGAAVVSLAPLGHAKAVPGILRTSSFESGHPKVHALKSHIKLSSPQATLKVPVLRPSASLVTAMAVPSSRRRLVLSTVPFQDNSQTDASLVGPA